MRKTNKMSHKKELHTGEEDTFAMLLANDTHSYDEKHRNDGMHRDVDNEHMATIKRPGGAYKTACKIDMMNKINTETNIETFYMGPHTRGTMDPTMKVLTEYREEPSVPIQ